MITFPRGRRILLGVGAGIAAYKACDLLRRLQDHGFLVDVVPTPASLNFVGKATWEALSGREVRSEVWEGTAGVSHVALGEVADLIVVAPATADLMARLATGRADDLLTTSILASNAPIIIVPAMHPKMWLNPATQANVALLRERNMTVVEPDTGRLTGPDSGVGRFPETARIIEVVQEITGRMNLLAGKKVVVTAGGTLEAIDPVRFIGNRSSGRQGLAIAHEAICEGAEVTVVAGVTEEFDLPGAEIVRVKSALEMAKAMSDLLPASDALVMAAAVADARPATVGIEKIAKGEFAEITLVENPDLLFEASRDKLPGQVFVGFAAETEGDLIERGMKKLHRKGVDLLYVTDVSNGGVFGEAVTTGALLSKRGLRWDFERADKNLVARKIVEELANELGVTNG